MTASRQFNFLRSLKWFGVSVAERFKTGCLAVLCPACAQLGINMDPNWESRPPELQCVTTQDSFKPATSLTVLWDIL